MEIEKLKSKLPIKAHSIEKFYSNCEKRNKFVHGNKEFAEKHLIKSKHDLFRATKEFQDECWDWTIIKAYYSIHHAANALLLNKKEFFSKDHSCLIIALSHYNLIPTTLFGELSELNDNFSSTLGLDLTFQLRKISQYSVLEWENMSKDDAALIINIAKKLVRFVENAINNE